MAVEEKKNPVKLSEVKKRVDDLKDLVEDPTIVCWRPLFQGIARDIEKLSNRMGEGIDFNA